MFFFFFFVFFNILTFSAFQMLCQLSNYGKATTSCCGTMEQVCATEGMLNTLNFNEKKNLWFWHVNMSDGGQSSR